MLSSIVTSIVTFCTDRRWTVIIAAVALALVSAVYAISHFAINTDTERLLPSNLPWQQHQLAYAALFPPHQITAVVEAPTPELADIAAEQLSARLRRRPDLFTAVREPQGGEFMQREALMYLPPAQAIETARRMAGARPAIAVLDGDPSLRGVMRLVSIGIATVRSHRATLDALARPASMLSDTLDQVLAGHFASLSWRALMNPAAPPSGQSREFIEIDPKLDFKAVQPGRAAVAVIRQAVDDLRLGPSFGATVRLTGRVPINDAQFATLGQSAIPGLIGTVVAVLAILWLALRSVRIMAAVFITLAIGFSVTAAGGLLMVGAFNLLSIAFAVLFIGLGADFAIQFCVRYRAERHEQPQIGAALRTGASKVGGPLALAAAGTAVGFFSFLPTQYRGVAELGGIAGFGMLAAFFSTITVLPALLAAFNPPGEPASMGFTALAPLDRFFARHRIAVVAGTLGLVIAASPLLLLTRFDFDPVNLENPDNEAVETYRQLTRVPELGIYAINVVVPSVAATGAEAQRLSALPQAAGTRTVASLVPDAQEQKLAAIRTVAAELDPVLGTAAAPAPSDNETIAVLRQTAGNLEILAAPGTGDGAKAALRLSRLLTRLADADAATRQRADAALAIPLKLDLDRLRAMLQPKAITVASLPPELAQDWVAPDGQARIEVLPRGDPSDAATLRSFANAVVAVAPDAAGTPVALIQSERTVLGAFAEAGGLAVAAIGIILWVALRRFGDVLLTLVPLLVAGLLTLELMVAIGQPLNFANVVALPLLLGVGVAFKIYYIMAWRTGRINLLQSTLTRAVVFSAATTATAFGSMWLSSQPGMSSMGKLMALSLLCTLCAAVLFQPALMGPPRVRRAATAEVLPIVDGRGRARQLDPAENGPAAVPVSADRLVSRR